MAEVLDPVQLKRIEALHRGFLFQHLFAVACLLRRPANLTGIVLERDEDVELSTPDMHVYVQVKTRSKELAASELKVNFERFRQLRVEHEKGARIGLPQFCLVTNAVVSDTTADLLDQEGVRLLCPDRPPSNSSFTLPGPWRDITEAMKECAEAAATVPFSVLQPETLVWKLAAIVAHASTGARASHQITTAELPSLCEQFIDQLHPMPEPPHPYRAQQCEPELGSMVYPFLGVALTGGGKTAWIAEASLHATEPVIYCDAAGLPDSAVPSTVLRELVASLTRMLGLNTSRILMPGNASFDGLRALNAEIAKSTTTRPVVIFDNAHVASPATVRKIVQSTPNFRWVFLAQPWPGKTLIEAHFGIRAYEFGGWSLETIATVFHDAGTQITFRLAQRVARLTGGLPLFVLSAARITADSYGGDVQAFCWEIELATNSQITPQAAILQAVIGHLSGSARSAASVFLLAEVPLNRAEARNLLRRALSIDEPAAAALIRELQGRGLLQVRFDGTIASHDAFRGVTYELQLNASPAVLREAGSALADLYKASFKPGEVDRLVAYCKLLRPLGRSAEVAGIISSLGEHLYDLGRSGELIDILIEITRDESVGVAQRFLAADTAVFWFLQQDKDGRYEEMLDTMAKLAAEGPIDPDDVGRLAFKRMTIAGERKDRAGIERAYQAALKAVDQDPPVLRILQYNYAVAQYQVGRYAEAEALARDLLREYEAYFGISYATQIQTKNLPEISERLGERSHDVEELKRFADILDLRARIMDKRGLPGVNLFLNAHKLYILGNAPLSAVKSGLDYVYGTVERRAFGPARTFMEGSLIPLVRHHNLLDEVVGVHSEYAVVLAYDGNVEGARQILGNLGPMVGSDGKEEFEHRRGIVERIADGRIFAPPLAAIPGQQHPFVVRTIRPGRNESCPCGSGIKYKKCCAKHERPPMHL